FIFSTTGVDGAPEATVPDQVAGVSFGPYWLRSVITNSTTKTCQAAFTSPHPVTFNYQCIDPATCSSGTTWLTIGSTTFGSAGATISLTFDGNGIASLGNFNFGDVGRIGISASATSAASATTVAGAPLFGTMKGTSGSNFVVKAYDFGVVPCAAAVVGNCITAPTDPGLVGGGSVFAKAGEAFKATVTARAFGGAATPNFGGGSNNGTEAVNLTRNRQAPTGGGTVDGALGGTTSIFRSSFSNGIATSLSDLSWSEVGVITLTATNTTFLTNSLSTTGTSGNLGRFSPDHFGLTGTVVTRSDVLPATGSTFTYMDEPMKLSLVVSAYNKSEGPTQNYTGSFAKLDAATLGSADLSKWTCTSGTQCMGLAAVFGSTPLTSRLVIDTTSTNSAAPSNTTWSGGTSYFTLYSKFRRRATIPDGNANPDGPYGDGVTSFLKIGGKPLDSDGVTLPPRLSTDTTHCVNLDVTTGAEDAACNPGPTEVNLRRKLFNTTLRFGRLTMQNMYGSEKLPLAIPLQAQYWNGSYFINNADDSLSALPVLPLPTTTLVGTSLPTGGSGLYFYPLTAKNSLSSGDVDPKLCTTTGAPPGALCGSVGVATSKLAGGQAKLQFLAPNKNHPGWLDIILPVPSYLLYNWGNCNGQGTDTLMNDNPCARATFGIYKSPLIYRRENY
ncbi:MAG TPA: DUF6701 domain-containing protein, partial [Rhodoferax sp.]